MSAASVCLLYATRQLKGWYRVRSTFISWLQRVGPSGPIRMAASLLPTDRATWRWQIAGRCTQQPFSMRRSASHARLIHVQYSSCPPCDCLYPSKTAPAWKSSIVYGTLVSGPVFRKQFAPPYLACCQRLIPATGSTLLTSLGSRRRSSLDTDCLCSRSLCYTSHTSRYSR